MLHTVCVIKVEDGDTLDEANAMIPNTLSGHEFKVRASSFYVRC